MRPGVFIKIEDDGDRFHKLSLLKDEDVRYELPSQVGKDIVFNKGEDNDERINLYRRRKKTFR